MAAHSIVERARRFLLREYWNIGVIDQDAADIARRGIVAPPRWLPPPAPGTMLADPFCWSHADGRRTLFAEYLDYRAPRGEIWSAELLPGADPVSARFQPLLAGAHHMSYPQIISRADGNRLICESWQSSGVPCWQSASLHGASLPGVTWQPAPPLIAGCPVVDPTVLHWRGNWYLFCTLHNDAPDARLHLFHAPTPDGPWTPHPGNPVQTGAGGSRPAGPIFMMDGTPIRPAQDCSRTYGGAVVLQAIDVLTPTDYSERQLRVLVPTGGDYPHGLHTLCPAGAVTLIDGKKWGMDPSPISQQLAARARRLLRRARPA